jgi:hypothetical protein
MEIYNIIPNKTHMLEFTHRRCNHPEHGSATEISEDDCYRIYEGDCYRNFEGDCYKNYEKFHKNNKTFANS